MKFKILNLVLGTIALLLGLDASAQQSNATGSNSTTPLPTFESSDYSRGFDPTESARSIWWTSVCQQQALMNEENEGNIDLNVNDHVIANFSAGTEQAYNIVVLNENGTNDTLMLTLQFFDTNDATKAPRGANQPLLPQTGLKITGKQHTRQDFATIYVCPKQGPQTLAHAVAKLYVYVLPLRTLTLGIWRVKSSPGGNTDISADYSAATIWNTYLFARRAYRQACIKLTNVEVPADVTAYYDVDPTNTAYDLDSSSESIVVEGALPPVAKVNVSIVKQFYEAGNPQTGVNGNTIMFGPNSMVNQTSFTGALGFQPTWFNVSSAHEIGHQFNLSQRPRNPTPPSGLLEDQFANHDTGPFPANWNGLLYPTIAINGNLVSVWLYHGDWSLANIAASLK